MLSKDCTAFNRIPMKSIALIILTILLIHLESSGQTFNEWFKQKKTQRKYLVEQIAALRVYLDYTKKAYTVVHRGLTTIENIKNGDFNLHRDFFSSLKNVNPAISKSAKVADIIAFQIAISKEMRNIYWFCESNDNFSPEEVRYIAKIHSNMLLLTDASVSELLSMLKNGASELTDQQRIKRLDGIYDELNDACSFIRVLKSDVSFLAMSRAKTKYDDKVIGKTYNL